MSQLIRAWRQRCMWGVGLQLAAAHYLQVS